MDVRRLVKVLKCLSAAAGLSLVVLAIGFGLVWHLYPFPVERLGQRATSPIVLEVKGRPMLSLVGPDDQWRFPVCLADVSPWLIQATIAVEDERFFTHPGVDLAAVVRAVGQNLFAGRIVSGASTLDMQICRMMDNRPRTCRAKLVEAFWALQLNRLMSKDGIMEVYLNVAPYGGNLRGVESASLKYFGKRAKDLSLAEAALLAGLPQSPSRYRPDRNPDAALGRRRVVLRNMFEKGLITEGQFTDAVSCPVVLCPSNVTCVHNQIARAERRATRDASFPIRRAMHASFLALSRRPAGGRTTIDLDIQDQVQRLARDHLATLPEGTELAVVVIDVAESAVVAVLGSGNPADPVDGQVNGVVACRSPGSALKPFLYATAFEMERLNGDSIVYDIPISRGAWTPSNFDRTHTPQVTAAEALRRSLNVPAILVAEGVGLARCCGVLEAVGVRLPPDAQQRGGLALAVGGIDVSLLDLTNAYATLARGGVRRQPRLFADESSEAVRALKPEVCAAISDILSSRKRPPADLREGAGDSIPWFMWKTGTSSGRRDAWAVGHNYRYAIGVWAGRFRGTGRLEYVGAQAAEPVLARLFSLASLRLDSDPPRPEAIRVRKPLALPKEVAEDVRITTPGDDETFIACGETAVVRASANRDDGNSWSLSGKLEGTGQVQRLVLRPGVYELRCVGRQGAPSTVRFSVCPSS
ncbi:MAG: penicillin-binding protein 1C [Phycisphaerae bacterium]|nr:penicillin-binding protein 1C [Phycisphaerae bacterium]